MCDPDTQLSWGVGKVFQLISSLKNKVFSGCKFLKYLAPKVREEATLAGSCLYIMLPPNFCPQLSMLRKRIRKLLFGGNTHELFNPSGFKEGKVMIHKVNIAVL